MVSMRSTVPAFGSAPSSVRIGGNRRMLRKQLAMLLGAFAIAIAASVQASPTVQVLAPAALLGSIGGGGDCNDLDAAVYPGHAEVVGNGYDDDCDGLADEDANNNPSADVSDLDGDTFSLANGDCNDHVPSIHPGATEIVGNYVDDDCDGLADEDAANHPSNDSADRDGDHVIIAPDAIFAWGFDPF